MQFYGTNNLPTGLAKRSFASELVRIMPNGEAPLFAMSGLAKRVTALQIEHHYWSKTMEFGKVTLNGAIVSATDTTLTVDNVNTVSVNDIIMVKSAFNAGAFVEPEIMRITAINSATEVEVERGFSGTTAKASIADNTVIPVIGNAYPEGSPRPTSKSIIPVRHENYTQIFRNGWSQAKTLAAVQQEVGNGTVAENRLDCTNFHSRDIELATFFGRKSSGIDAVTGQPLHTMDGLEAIINANSPNNIKEAGATTSYDQLITLLDPLMDSRTDVMSNVNRVIYAGKQAINTINAIGRLSGEYQIVQRQNAFGLKFTEFRIPRGMFTLIEHPIFNTHPDWEKLAVVGELSAFDFAYLSGRDTEVTFINEGGKDTDGADATGGVLTTELTAQLRNPFAWGFIYNLTAGAA